MNKSLLTGWTAIIVVISFSTNVFSQGARDSGIVIGVMSTGSNNAITDVDGIKVGHTTLIQGDSVRTGVTAIVPSGDIFNNKLTAAFYRGNGFGKFAGSSQIQELGNLETPIILTNTLSVGVAIEALVRWTISKPGNENVKSVNAVVGETNDSYLNDIRGMHITQDHVIKAIESSVSGEVAQGNVGAGTGTTCFGYKGGIGTASRKLPVTLGGYTVGVLVQTNFGGNLTIDGVAVGEKLGNYPFKSALEASDGSCMIVVATDAPVDSRNLERMAKRAMMGLAKTGGIASNGSGDFVVALSTYEENRVPHQSNGKPLSYSYLHNDDMSALFMATIEATEEAIINSLFYAEDMKGFQGHERKALPKEKVLKMLKK